MYCHSGGMGDLNNITASVCWYNYLCIFLPICILCASVKDLIVNGDISLRVYSYNPIRISESHPRYDLSVESYSPSRCVCQLALNGL